MKFSLSLSGEKLRRTFVVFFALSSVLPVLIVLIIVNHYVLPEMPPGQASRLKDLFAYGVSAMILIPLIGFVLMSRWVRSLEGLARGIKAKMTLWSEQGKNIEMENEVEILEFIFNELESKTRQLSIENTERRQSEEALVRSERVYRSFAQVGMALSAEKDINRLLEMIVESAKELSYADAGTLYIIDDDERYLHFEIMQNDSLKIKLGGTSGTKVTFPDVPLYIEGKPNYSNVSSYVVLTDKTVNIEDVYEVKGFDFTGPRKYDSETGYRSKSMLVVPMKNHENHIIGVLQLLNAQNPESGEVTAFSPEHTDMIASLASQAAVAMTNTKLIHDLDSLLNAFIKSIATAIDEKSPYTGGHIKRVVELSTMIAERINQTDEGPYKNIHFTQDEMAELRMAAWMHDVGKITTPDYVVDKANKLASLFDRIELVALRFDLIEKLFENSYLQKKIGHLLDGKSGEPQQFQSLDEELDAGKEALRNDLAFIRSVNITAEFMPNDKLERILRIGTEKYVLNGVEYPYLDGDEIENLSVRKGNLTEKERKVVENHVLMTTKILSQLPFPRKLARVPKFAGEHHERLDGSGYHQGMDAKGLLLQSRIIAFADIFEALTAKDRPYRKPLQLPQVINILGFMKKDRHIDPDIYDFFMTENLHLEYTEKEMLPEPGEAH